MDPSNALAPQASILSSSIQVEVFNSAARDAFHLMLDARKHESRERMTAAEKLIRTSGQGEVGFGFCWRRRWQP